MRRSTVSLGSLQDGLGLVGVAVATAAYRDTSAGSIARATGAISVVHRLGASSGTAVMAVILAIRLRLAGAEGEAVVPAAVIAASNVVDRA